MKRAAAIATGLVLLAGGAQAHVGSFDAVEDGMAGPYHVLVTIRPPDVIPGIARIDVRAFDGDVRDVRVVPLPMARAGRRFTAGGRRRGPERQRRAALWQLTVVDASRLVEIRVTVDGARGAGELSVPIPALARTTRAMPPYLGGLLVAVMALLAAAAIAIAGATARESDLEPGVHPDWRRLARGRRAMIVTGTLLALALWGGMRWWRDEAVGYRKLVYKPLDVRVTQPAPDELALSLVDPGWLRWRRTDDLIPDHGHLMHLFLVRTPGLDAIAHLHPRRAGDGSFDQAVPRLPAGTYRLYGDIVHANGIDETVATTLPLAGTGSGGKANRDRFDPDDAVAVLPAAASAQAPAFAFADGAGRLLWLDARAARAGQTIVLEIEADGADGRPLPGVEPYMGMAGHAMIIARDGSVFAHIHPTGSFPWRRWRWWTGRLPWTIRTTAAWCSRRASASPSFFRAAAATEFSCR